jgi:hypothetical protein
VDADALLEPTLKDHRGPAERPWALSAQRLVAVFGGALAFGFVAALNTRRLGLPRKAAYQIAAIALGLEALMFLLVVGTGHFEVPGVLFTGLVAYWCSYQIQVTPDRVHHYYTRDEPYEPCEIGVLACLVLRPIEIGLLVALVP